MLIVAGTFTVAPEERDEFLAAKLGSITATRQEAGCLAYAMTADPVEDDKVLLFERWADQTSFDAHMAGVASRPPSGGPTPTGMSIEVYDISGTRQFG
jgi:quinol monooxygenase YgiN